MLLRMTLIPATSREINSLPAVLDDVGLRMLSAATTTAEYNPTIRTVDMEKLLTLFLGRWEKGKRRKYKVSELVLYS